MFNKALFRVQQTGHLFILLFYYFIFLRQQLDSQPDSAGLKLKLSLGLAIAYKGLLLCNVLVELDKHSHNLEYKAGNFQQ